MYPNGSDYPGYELGDYLLQDEDEYLESPSPYSLDSMVKVTLITVIFYTSLIGNATMVFVVNRTSSKTLCQKMLLSILGITCIIRGSVTFIRDMYVAAFHNVWQFNEVTCKADAFLDNFSTAAFPYVLMFLVLDSGQCILSKLCRKTCNCSRSSTSPCANLAKLVLTFVCICSFCTIFATVLTAMTTKQEINSYGEGITVNSTVCLLDDMRGGKYMKYHSIIWLIAVPLGLISLFYTCLAFMACMNRCNCNPDEEIHICRRSMNSTRNTERNWLITVILLVIIYIVCYVPYELSSIVLDFFNKSPSKTGVMIVFFLYYAPPAVLPLVLGTINVIVRESYYKHLFCVKTRVIPVDTASDKDDIISNRTNNSPSSSLRVQSEDNVYDKPVSTVSLSACSDPDLDPDDYGDENTRIIQKPLRDSDTSNSTNCSYDETWSPQVNTRKKIHKEKSKSRKSLGSDDIEDTDNDDKPMLVTSV